MGFQLQNIEQNRVYQSVAEQLLAGVTSGAFAAEKALPPERVLAEQLGVSRSSVREAVRVLEHAGVLDVRTGKGTYVTRDAMSKATLLRVEAATKGQYSPLDIIVARRAIEPASADLAAAHCSQDELASMRAAVARQSEHLEHGLDPTEADLEFHLLIAGASHNTVHLVLTQAIVDMMHQQMWLSMKHQSLADRARAEAYLRQHEAILAQIANGDGEASAQAMRTHLEAVEEGLLAT